MVLADRDQEASSKYAAKIASRLPIAEIRHYPANHFEVYLPPLREEIRAIQTAFLQRHLTGTDDP